jgi:hypothetical protein
MPQACKDLDLAMKTICPECRALFRLKNFERNGAIVPHVVSEIDGGHSSTAKLTLEIVSASEGVTQASGDTGVTSFLSVFVAGRCGHTRGVGYMDVLATNVLRFRLLARRRTMRECALESQSRSIIQRTLKFRSDLLSVRFARSYIRRHLAPKIRVLSL